jgi:molybdenum cofactor sulfurtransferase
MCLISTKIDLKQKILFVSAPGKEDLVVDVENRTLTSKSVKVCGDKCFGYLHGDKNVSDWFTSYIGVRCWLVKWAEDTKAFEGDNTGRLGFANEAPILVLSLSSIRQLNSVLKNNCQREVDAKYFRPNIVVSTKIKDNLNTEDGWKKIHFTQQKLSLKITGHCQRCSMIDIDPSSGIKGHTLRALAEFRRKHGGSHLTFGVFATVEKRSDISKSGCGSQRLWINVGDTMIFE